MCNVGYVESEANKVWGDIYETTTLLGTASCAIIALESE